MALRGNQCECTVCGERFRVVSTFDQHRTGIQGARRCLTLDEMTAKGWATNVRGFWYRPFKGNPANIYARGNASQASAP